MLLAGGRDYDIFAAFTQDSQRLQHQCVIFVSPKLIGHEDKVLRQTIAIGDGPRRDKIESLAGRHREMDGSGAASRGGIETFAPLSRIVAAKHDAASSHDLGSKPDLAFPPGR